MESLRIKGFVIAEIKSAHFRTIKSTDPRFDEQWKNPAFFQKLLDSNIDITDPDKYYHVSAGNDHNDLGVDFPWFDGNLHIVDGIAYIIDKDWERYCEMQFYVPVRDAVHLTELLSVVYSIAYVGWRKGFESGEQRRARLIRDAMNP